MLGEPVKTRHFADHQGRRVYFCCGTCKKKFARDPGEYVANLALIEVAGAVPAEASKGVDRAAESAEAPDRTAPPHDRLHANDDSLKSLSDYLFATDNEQLHVRRREIRLRQLVPPPDPPDAAGPIQNEIDRFIVGAWRSAGLPQAGRPPPLCDDAVFVRRVYLDLIGVIPTMAEARRFLDDPSPDKRSRLIDDLLARSADYAAHWTPFWEDALGSATTALQGGVPTRGSYRDWIFRNFEKNKPFDVLAAELIDPSMPGHQPSTVADANGRKSRIGFVLNETHKDTLQTAANVAQVFLGTSMKCASCHNHFENPEWPQARFLGFAGMFSASDLERIRCEAPSGDFIAAAFPFEIPGAPTDVPADLNGRLRRAAQLLTDPANPRFARAIVNRLWKRYLGLGLFEPADDFRLDRAPSHPELLDWLADDFMRHGFDLKHTIRLILNSRTYQLAYDPALEDHFDLAKPAEPRAFRSPTLRRLSAEQLIDSLRVAMSQRLEPGRRLYLDKTSTALTRALGKPASRNEISTARPDDVAIVQALELLNGEEYHRLVYGGPVLRELIRQDSPEMLIEMAYQAVLSRAPTAAEMSVAREFLTASAPDAGAGPTNGDGTKDAAREVVWIDDELPAGGEPTPTWKWVEAPAGPVFSGRRSHTQDGMTGPRSQHFVLGASPPLQVGPLDTLFVHVYLDPADPPTEIMLQWHTDGWEHRAFWGEDLIPFGRPNSPSRLPAGALPEAGRWVRLEVAAADVEAGGGLIGISFDQTGGTVYWDAAGIVRVPPDPRYEPLGDLLWALFTSPEFQYIR
jgi:YHS domain-containing protein